MNRRERHGAILELVRDRALSTQAEVASALRDAGFDVVQTTVSRDIAELGLVKVRAPSGRLVYAPPGGTDGDRAEVLAGLKDGERVVISPPEELAPGKLIVIKS